MAPPGTETKTLNRIFKASVAAATITEHGTETVRDEDLELHLQGERGNRDEGLVSTTRGRQEPLHAL